MITITRWAGKHPLFVRIVLLPILFYVQGRMAFIAGADLFFDGVLLPMYWFWGMVAVLWLITVFYPANARSILHSAYWRIKSLEWIACTVACGLWFYVGNQMAQQVEGVPVRTPSTVTMVVAGVISSESTAPETKSDNKLKKAYRNYFRNAVKQIKRTHRSQKLSTVLGVIVGILAISFGVAVLVCSIQCSSAGGGTALGVVSGIALIGLGILALVVAFSRKSGTTPKE